MKKVFVSKTKKVSKVSKKKVVTPSKKTLSTICERNKMIRGLYASGDYSCRSLAKKIGLSKSRIHEIVG